MKMAYVRAEDVSFLRGFLGWSRSMRQEPVCMFRRGAETAGDGKSQRVPGAGTGTGTGGYTCAAWRGFRSGRSNGDSFLVRSRSTGSSCRKKDKTKIKNMADKTMDFAGLPFFALCVFPILFSEAFLSLL